MWRGRICSLDSMAELVVDDCCNFYMLFLLVLGFLAKIKKELLWKDVVNI